MTVEGEDSCTSSSNRLVFNLNNGSADPFGHLLVLARQLNGNVIEGMKVIQNTSANMTVLVGAGSALIPTGTYPTSFAYHVANTNNSGESVTVTTANTSNPRIDTIVAYVNTSATITSSPSNNPGVLVHADVAGTPASSPSAPSGATIQSAIGAANPYIVLANVLVGANVTSIVNSNITDLRLFTTSHNPYAFRVYEGAGFTNTASTFTKIPYNTRTFDTLSNFDITTNHRYTATAAGNYHFSAVCQLYATTSGTTIGVLADLQEWQLV